MGSGDISEPWTQGEIIGDSLVILSLIRQDQTDPLDPRPGHGCDFELKTVEAQGFSGGRDVLQPLQQEPRQRVMVVCLGQLEVQLAVQLENLEIPATSQIPG